MRWLLRLSLLVVIAAGATFGAKTWLANWARAPVEGLAKAVEIEVKQGTTIRGVARELQTAGVTVNDDLFAVMTRIERAGVQPKVGYYRIQPGESPLGIFDRIAKGDAIMGEVRFIEGWTFPQFRRALADNPDLRRETSSLPDAEVLQRVGAIEKHPEGLFFPDTYPFPKGTTDLAILKRAYSSMQKQVQAQWAQRPATSPLKTPYELLVLASIVEKETGRPEDRGLVAAVFSNRLRIGMRLQADPTVIYGVGSAFDGNLRKRDLTTDTPYNTYTRAGLPPTPIAMPGAASLRAAMQPDASNVLYFVARGDGTSAFSRTLEEHNAAVNRYQRGGG